MCLEGNQVVRLRKRVPKRGLDVRDVHSQRSQSKRLPKPECVDDGDEKQDSREVATAPEGAWRRHWSLLEGVLLVHGNGVLVIVWLRSSR